MISLTSPAVFLTIEAFLCFQAVRDYRKALDIDEGFQAAKEGLNTAQKRQKQASKRDYYKILGVKRSDRKKDILKAYR